MSGKYNSDLAKCLEELSKSITEFENLQSRLDGDIEWLKRRLEEGNVILEDGTQTMTDDERAQCEQDLAQEILLKDFVSGIAVSVETHAVAITNKLLNKEGA